MPAIDITNVEIRPVVGANSLRNTLTRGWATVQLGGAIALDNFRIRIGKDGRMLVDYPVKPCNTRCRGCGARTATTVPLCGHCGEEIPGGGSLYREIVTVLDPALARAIEAAVLRAYVTHTTTAKAS